VRVRPLKGSVTADCEILLADPTAALHRELFAPAEAWLLEPGRALPLVPRRGAGCEAFLVDAQGLPMTLIAWAEADFPETLLPTGVAQADAQPGRMIMMRQGEGELTLDDHPAVFDAPAPDAFAPEPACAVPDATVGVAWSELPQSPQALVAVTSSPDGCHDIELAQDSFYVCLPFAELPFAAGEIIDARQFGTTSGYDDPDASYAGGIEIIGERVHIRAVRGGTVLTPDPDGAYDVSFETKPGCSPHHDACGNYVTPLAVTYLGSGAMTLGAGDSAYRTEEGSTLYLVRAQAMPIRDAECAELEVESSGAYFESVLVTTIPSE
jgi:hypothetical protein